MWASFKAAFAATVGALVAWKLVGLITDPDFLGEMGEKADDFVSDWKESRKVSHPERYERD